MKYSNYYITFVICFLLIGLPNIPKQVFENRNPSETYQITSRLEQSPNILMKIENSISETDGTSISKNIEALHSNELPQVKKAGYKVILFMGDQIINRLL